MLESLITRSHGFQLVEVTVGDQMALDREVIRAFKIWATSQLFCHIRVISVVEVQKRELTLLQLERSDIVAMMLEREDFGENPDQGGTRTSLLH